MSEIKLFLLPVFMQVILTIYVLLVMGARRRVAFKAGKVGRDAMLNDRSWPADVLKASNNYQNQFEIPVLFYAASAIIVAASAVNTAQIVMAWLFIAARIVHTTTHLGANTLSVRFVSFFVSLIAAACMWAILAVRVFF